MKLASYEIIGDAEGPHVLITGGVHGDEFEPMAAIRQLMTEIRPAELRGRVTLVPVVNEPAFARGERTADDGLDLARTCPGRADGSVTEQIAFALSSLIRTSDLYIDLHTGGTRLMVWPLTGYVLHADERILNQQRRMARAFGLPLIWGTDPTLPGRSLSVARDANVPAIYAEYLGGGRLDPQGIAAYVTGCLNVLREFEMLPTLPGSTSAPEPRIVEDARPGSGHMQVNHPSPCAGYFQPHVELGQAVQKGDAIGAVSDPLGQHVETIRARYTGTVIVLHTFPRVAAETSVAVILKLLHHQPENSHSMRNSVIKAKLAKNQPVLLTTLHFGDPSIFEMTSLMGWDGIWLDLEHHGHSVETAAHFARAARVGASDIMIRPAKGEFMRMGRILEIGATGIMYPRCDNAEEAKQVVRWSKFAPLGERGIDSGNCDNPYCMMPLADYIKAANEQTFIVIQIEDPKHLPTVHAEAMAAVDGVDILFLGPGDFSILAGIPGQFDHPKIKDAMKQVAAAAKKAGKHWGMPIFSVEHAKEVLELGGRFLCHGADLLMVKNGLEDIAKKFAPLGVTFDRRV